MGYRKGERVRVKDSPMSWFGFVVERTKTGYTIRPNRHAKEVAVEKAQVFPPYDTAPEVLGRAIPSHSLLLLGCKDHGDTCADTLIKYHHDNPNRRFDTVFMENFYYDEKDGVQKDTLHLPKHKDKMLEDLRKICNRVVGLETEETAPVLSASPSLEDIQKLTKFANDQRCTVANKAWASLINKNMSGSTSSSTSVVCCGAAHLVKIQEGNGVADPLQTHLTGLNLRIPVYAVANTKDGLYKPEGSTDSLHAFPPLSTDDDDDDSAGWGGSDSDS